MARIAGVDIPREKRIVIALTYIYGIGKTTSQKILAQAEISEDTRVRDLTNDELDRLRAASLHTVEFATVVVYQFVVKTLRTTHVRVKVKLSQFKVRKNNLKGG